jgi:hypothetical protein
MSKKILVISGSLRKGGNSDILCDEFIKGAQESGNTAEKIYLKDKKIGFCTACYGCRETHECVQKDDMTEILEKMALADVDVLATSVDSSFGKFPGGRNQIVNNLVCYGLTGGENARRHKVFNICF